MNLVPPAGAVVSAIKVIEAMREYAKQWVDVIAEDGQKTIEYTGGPYEDVNKHTHNKFIENLKIRIDVS